MSFDSTTDDNLCELLARGEETAWYVFHQRYTERLIRYARAVVKHDEIALDVVQAVMVGLVRNRSRLGTVRDLEAYLFSAVRRDLWRALKQERKEKAILVPFDRERGDDVDSLRISGTRDQKHFNLKFWRFILKGSLEDHFDAKTRIILKVGVRHGFSLLSHRFSWA
jgi:DNA-directed RNA polymerase specialized sigma24 family protein